MGILNEVGTKQIIAANIDNGVTVLIPRDNIASVRVIRAEGEDTTVWVYLKVSTATENESRYYFDGQGADDFIEDYYGAL